MTRRTYFGLLAAGAADLRRFGVKGDGRADDTAALQKALDAAAAKGGTVFLPAGKYLVAGSLTIPPGVALVEADGGRLQVRGCTFGSREPNIVPRKGLVHAIIGENNGAQGVSIVNNEPTFER